MGLIGQIIEFISANFISFILPLVGAVVGILLRSTYEWWRDKRKFRKELINNDLIDITGDDWHAAWQTCVDGKEVINTETLVIKQVGQTVRVHNTEKSAENPEGGYLWEGQLQFFNGRHLMGWYFPKASENNSSKGIMFFSYFSQRKTLYGRWVGTAYDGDLVSGCAVISTSKARALSELDRLRAQSPDTINIISNSFPVRLREVPDGNPLPITVADNDPLLERPPLSDV